MNSRHALSLISALVLAGCQSAPSGRLSEPRVPPPPPPPPRNEFAWSTAGGANVIEGRAAWRRRGVAYTCAGQSVGLIPETPYTRLRMVERYGSTERAIRSVAEVQARSTSEPARDYTAYVHSTKCDDQGRFAFRGLPDGGWFVIARVAPKTGEADVALRRILAAGGETREVTIAPEPDRPRSR